MKPLSSCRSQLPSHGIREIMVKASEIPGSIHLEVGEPSADTPPHIQAAAIQAINEGYFHYTHNLGLLSLRKTFADFLRRTYALPIDAGQIAVTPGAVAALAISLLAVVDAGEEVLIPDPSWPNYAQMVISQGSIPVRYELKPENDFQPSLAEIEKLVSGKTKAIIINSPGNPTGAVFDKLKMGEIMDFACKHDLYVISDEIYDRIIYDGEHVPALGYDSDGRTVAIYGTSKNFAMTGWRIGFAVASPKIIASMEKIIEPLVSCTNTIAQKAAEAAYSGPQEFTLEMCEVYRKHRDIAYQIFQQAGVKAYKPKGAFYMLVDLTGTEIPPSEIGLRLLNEAQVAAGPGITFGNSTQNMIRISLAGHTPEIIEGAERICRFVNSYNYGRTQPDLNENELRKTFYRSHTARL